MRVRYTLQAAKQIEAALAHVAADSPQGSRNLRDRIFGVVAMLQGHPQAGRPTSKPGIRRFSLSPYPYVIDYRPDGDEIVVRRFRHTARRPLP